MKSPRYWLMKSEPDVFSIDDLKASKTSLWDGVRNYQARNFMMNDMKVGDLVLFYHSNAKPPGVAGVAVISKEAVPDVTAQDEKSKYYDPKAAPEKPIWFCVEVKFKSKFKNFVSLDELRDQKALKEMLVLKRGQRLSIQPVTAKEFDTVVKLGSG
ncbi:MAG: EVE domain-containing protein [Bdellovibrionaceae bacterium]|nr:EVE domain-containing protein [Pseudobdellovibrionaceae bacterium]